MSGKLQPMALTSINTWPGPGVGSATSAYCISDGSPHWVAIMAFMSVDHTMTGRRDRERRLRRARRHRRGSVGGDVDLGLRRPRSGETGSRAASEQIGRAHV